jgi:hypothetical protein
MGGGCAAPFRLVGQAGLVESDAHGMLGHFEDGGGRLFSLVAVGPGSFEAGSGDEQAAK